MRIWLRCATATLLIGALLGACGDDNGDSASEQVEQALQEARQQAQEAAEALEQAGETAGARTVAEALRTALVVEDLEQTESLRDVDVLREAVDDLPGDPQVSGIEDGDGDGRDDDGQIEVIVGEERACLTLPDDGGDIDVSNQAC